MGFALTVLEIAVAFILIIGFTCEDKLADFERAVATFIKRKFRKMIKRSRASVRYVGESRRIASDRHCA